MDNFGSVRALAASKRNELLAASASLSTVELLTAARKATGLKVSFVAPASPLLSGGDGALHRSSKAIYISKDLPSDMAAFVEAHEFGHYWIESDDDVIIVGPRSDPGDPEEPSPLGLKRVEAYSPKELRERLANVFGREFLLPRSEARRLFLNEGRTAPAIAQDLNIPLGLVHQQLATALLLPTVAENSQQQAKKISKAPPLDPSQKTAAEHEGSPLLVEAGPGTGKTRTLVAKIEHLLRKGVPAPSILALTFSNKAAREIKERVAASVPTASGEIWAGTFHAFGLEIVRKYGHLGDAPDPLRLLDQADQLELLERHLNELELEHYLRLHDPLSELRHVLTAISRAKDEVKSPEDYAAAAEVMRKTAANDEDCLAAAKAAEVARIYAFYDQRMRRDGLVDFGDLINRPLEIFKDHPEVLDEIREQYRHLLVDEYQDVNRASALLVKALAGEGNSLWVVGDARQSIYRFRGAAPINTRDFEVDYPTGKRAPLGVNYRSRKQIVDTFDSYAGAMSVGGGRSAALEAKRGPGAEAVDCNVARDREAEIAGIAEAIKARKAGGISYKDQAVLCRSHGNLERVALGLEACGVPILYLGDLFERPEVSDLLSMISFAAEPHRGGLYRVAAMAPYRIPLSDVRAFLSYATEVEKTPLKALGDIAAIDGISDEGGIGFAKLAADLKGVGFKTGPGTFLYNVLFDRKTVLMPFLAGDQPVDQQGRLAIHQFLQFAIECDKKGEGDPKRHLLDWIRRLEMFGDERALREPPSAIDGIDAVRLMTVHASKGLEFEVVHLPFLGKGMFPLSWSGRRCPLPSSLLPTVPKEDHAEEEECLFYVALSRARDHISLSRAERYSDARKSNASEALLAIDRHLPRRPDAIPNWTGRLPAVPDGGSRPDLAVEKNEHDGRDIKLFLDCPRRYAYQVCLEMSRGREDSGYVRFHGALYRVLGWIASQGGTVEQKAVDEAFEAAWQEIGPHDHPLETLYRSHARRILDHAKSRPRTGVSLKETVSFALDGHEISVPIDEIERSGSDVVFRRLRTGRPPSKPDLQHLHAIMLQAGRATYGGAGRFEIHYFGTNATIPVKFDRVLEDRLNDTRDALSAIAGGIFPDRPRNDEDCPRCPHYFICPTLPE